jgi:hypothetical protein
MHCCLDMHLQVKIMVYVFFYQVNKPGGNRTGLAEKWSTGPARFLS